MSALLKVDPVGMLMALLPPGNQVNEVTLMPDGKMHCIIDGIDAPASPDGQQREVELLFGRNLEKGSFITWIETCEPPPETPGLQEKLDALIAKRKPQPITIWANGQQHVFADRLGAAFFTAQTDGTG